MTTEQHAAARARAERLREEKERAAAAQRDSDRARQGEVPLHMSAVAEELARQLPADALLYDESLTHFPELLRWLPPRAPGQLLQTPGGTLGVGIPGAIGAKLAHPDQTVVGFTGDGGAMYTFPALWTAAHRRIGAKLVVCNNRSYRLLKENILDYWRTRGLMPADFPASFPPAFDVDRPAIDYVSLAAGLGVPGRRVEQPADVAPAIRAMLEHDGPYLLELVLEGAVARPAA